MIKTGTYIDQTKSWPHDFKDFYLMENHTFLEVVQYYDVAQKIIYFGTYDTTSCELSIHRNITDFLNASGAFYESTNVDEQLIIELDHIALVNTESTLGDFIDDNQIIIYLKTDNNKRIELNKLNSPNVNKYSISN